LGSQLLANAFLDPSKPQPWIAIFAKKKICTERERPRFTLQKATSQNRLVKQFVPPKFDLILQGLQYGPVSTFMIQNGDWWSFKHMHPGLVARCVPLR